MGPSVASGKYNDTGSVHVGVSFLEQFGEFLVVQATINRAEVTLWLVI